MAEWVREFDRRPDGRGFESHCELFASELWQFRLPRFAKCCLSETVKAVGPFYLVSITLCVGQGK